MEERGNEIVIVLLYVASIPVFSPPMFSEPGHIHISGRVLSYTNTVLFFSVMQIYMCVFSVPIGSSS